MTPAIAGRPLTGGVSNIVVNLADPTQLFYDYVYSNDAQLSRIFKVGGTRRVRLFMEAFNLVNNSTIYTRNETYGPLWYDPISLVSGRRFQFGAQLDF